MVDEQIVGRQSKQMCRVNDIQSVGRFEFGGRNDSEILRESKESRFPDALLYACTYESMLGLLRV